MSRQKIEETQRNKLPKKRPYRPPTLTDYGDLRNTLGARPRIGESGNPMIFRA